MSSSRPKIVVIQGATASGKSALAIKIALRFGGELVNSDSLQWVRHFDIGTAKPDMRERAIVAHHLFDVVDPDEHADVGRYVEMARAAVEEILIRDMLPIVVGGTGLYVRALLGGLVDLPQRNDELRSRYEQVIQDRGLPKLFAMLEEKAPEAALHIDRHNPPRVIRALEVLELTGKTIWDLQEKHRFRDRPYDALMLAVASEKEVLDRRIAERTRRMLADGLVEEVRSLLRRYPDRSLKPYSAIGYRQVLEMLDGLLAEEDLEESICRATRRYAKKQGSWLRGEEELRWFGEGEDEKACGCVADFISGNL